MADWNPGLYARFEDERTRPARDLLARCRIGGDRRGAGLRIADLGCGPGNSTALLVERFPEAEIIGYDMSEAMLEAARRRLPGVRFERADIGAFAPGASFDLLFSNAALQWVTGHARLLPALFSHVRSGGLLAAQIPDNLGDSSQVAMRDIAADVPFSAVLGAMDEARETIAPREAYYDWLASEASEVDVWTTVYNHPMESPQAITDWFTSTGLKPFLDPLDAAMRAAFSRRYTQEMDRRYPPRADGRRLLAFPRLFVVARKA
ncbi:trans-aconitate 2-methyltransferase [Aureimonas sp. Leaf324]|uniref:trans-aconitate 2-methyltransferase n=1 Tax=Aureimonas sp. Leaf324 TaxID=1736336 RepID=UPI0006F735E1|nr:trans-aconitate 2-methyltransferase [Aureimonas sp. Leaf324]KQQ79015.1 trans-aconitate methyltransferase [Aureimonas sp. Leaf324]